MSNELLEYLKSQELYYKKLAHQTNNSSLSDFYLGKAYGIKSVGIHIVLNSGKEYNNGSYK